MTVVEESMESRDAQLNTINEMKQNGNSFFGNGEFEKAEEEAIKLCPSTEVHIRSVLLSNLSAAQMKQSKWHSAVESATDAIKFDNNNVKALERRAFSNSNIPEKYELAIDDYVLLQTLCEIRRTEFQRKIEDVNQKIIERNEKLKEDVVEKLKTFGNFCLKPFGLSTDSFELKQGENGGFSVQMKESQTTATTTQKPLETVETAEAE